LQIIIASVGATISGAILLLIHHSRVKQELEIHRKRELFDRKQKTYRLLMRDVFRDLDYVTNLGRPKNWRVTRDVYNELLLIGGKEVIDAYNEYIKKYDQLDDVQGSQMVKNLAIVIRKDLYGEIISSEQVKFMAPSRKSRHAIEIYAKNHEKLSQFGFDTFELFVNMDIEDIHSKTGISREELKELKDQGNLETTLFLEREKMIEKNSE
jgi:hypothetical protein